MDEMWGTVIDGLLGVWLTFSWEDVVQLGQRAASSWWGTTNRQLPFGLTEQLRVCKRFLNTINTVRSLGEDALGG